MKNFKKACKTTVLFLLILVILSASVMGLFFQSESYFYQDYRERDELAGTLDTLILGSSHGLRAFVPEIMDKKLGVNSYNLAGSLMTMQGKYEMLRTEADRNPVKTVILEMAASSLTRNRSRIVRQPSRICSAGIPAAASSAYSRLVPNPWGTPTAPESEPAAIMPPMAAKRPSASC